MVFGGAAPCAAGVALKDSNSSARGAVTKAFTTLRLPTWQPETTQISRDSVLIWAILKHQMQSSSSSVRYPRW
jgi:hypothetical protein